MCLNQLGVVVQASGNTDSADASVEDAGTSKTLDGTLESLMVRLKDHTAKAGSGGSSCLDSTLLGAGLQISRELQSPAAGNRQTLEVLNNHSNVLKETLLEEGKTVTQALLDGYHPEKGWTQPLQPEAVVTFQTLCQVPSNVHFKPVFPRSWMINFDRPTTRSSTQLAPMPVRSTELKRHQAVGCCLSGATSVVPRP